MSEEIPLGEWQKLEGREPTLAECLANGGRLLVIWALRSMPYAEYLETAHWESVRNRCMRDAKCKCYACKVKMPKHVHHNTYDRRGEELPQDVHALCVPCHKFYHDTMSAVMRAEKTRLFGP